MYKRQVCSNCQRISLLSTAYKIKVDCIRNEYVRRKPKVSSFFGGVANTRIDGVNMFFTWTGTLYQIFIIRRVVVMYNGTENNGLTFNSTQNIYK